MQFTSDAKIFGIAPQLRSRVGGKCLGLKGASPYRDTDSRLGSRLSRSWSIWCVYMLVQVTVANQPLWLFEVLNSTKLNRLILGARSDLNRSVRLCTELDRTESWDNPKAQFRLKIIGSSIVLMYGTVENYAILHRSNGKVKPRLWLVRPYSNDRTYNGWWFVTHYTFPQLVRRTLMRDVHYLPFWRSTAAVSTDLHGIPRLFPRRSTDNEAIPNNRHPVKTIFTTIPIDRQCTISFVWTIPINWKYQTSVVQSIPINRLQNHLTWQHQLLESTRHQLFKQFRLIDSPRRQLSEQIQLIDSLRSQLSKQFQLLDSLLTSLARTIPINRQLRDCCRSNSLWIGLLSKA